MEILHGENTLFSAIIGPHPDAVKNLRVATARFESAKATLNIVDKTAWDKVGEIYNELIELRRSEVPTYLNVSIFDRSVINLPVPTRRCVLGE